MLHYLDIEKAKRRIRSLELPRRKRKLDVRTVESNIDIAGDATKKMRIRYNRLRDGQTVLRTVSPYEVRRESDDLWATCQMHDNQIHRFKLSRILGAKVLTSRFRPKYPVLVGTEEE